MIVFIVELVFSFFNSYKDTVRQNKNGWLNVVKYLQGYGDQMKGAICTCRSFYGDLVCSEELMGTKSSWQVNDRSFDGWRILVRY